MKLLSRNHTARLAVYLTARVPTASPADTVREVEARLVQGAGKFSSLDYVYLVDAEHRFKGVVSVREMFRENKDARLSHLKLPDVFFVHPHSHPERAAYLALKHGVQGIPVVDQSEKFVGAITSSSLLKILDKGAIEDMLRFGGIFHSGTYDNIFGMSIHRSLFHRLPWLAVGLAGGFLTAGIIGSFEDFLGKNIIIAAYIPLVVYMASAVGAQLQAFIVRDLAVQPSLPFGAYALRQTGVVGIIAAVVGFAMYALTLLLYSDPALSLVLSFALCVAIASSVITGLLVPYAFEKMSLDPASASGPVGTIIQDLISVLVYFKIASVILS